MPDTEEPLVPVFIPALVALLLNAEQRKGEPLTEQEVLAVRGSGACIMLPLSERDLLFEKRGYDDIDPEDCWRQWLAVRGELVSG